MVIEAPALAELWLVSVFARIPVVQSEHVTFFDSTQSQESKSEVCAQKFCAAMHRLEHVRTLFDSTQSQESKSAQEFYVAMHINESICHNRKRARICTGIKWLGIRRPGLKDTRLVMSISLKVLVILLCDSSTSVCKESGVLYMSLENK